MRYGLYLRSMGPQSTTAMMLGCARAAEAAGIDDLWVGDHVAIPPDDAEGSGGRYLDPLATLAWLAGVTERIGLGTGVLVLPYRPALATAKWVATIQELSSGRMRLGVGVGWMEAEFLALGVPRAQRGRITDQTLAFLRRCFANDEVEANGQPFLFRPRPERPPILVGGAPPHALHRAIEHGDGWMPTGGDVARLRPAIDTLREMAQAAGKPAPQVVLVTALPLEDESRAAQRVAELAAIGVTGIAHAWRYRSAEEFAATADMLARVARSHAG